MSVGVYVSKHISALLYTTRLRRQDLLPACQCMSADRWRYMHIHDTLYVLITYACIRVYTHIERERVRSELFCPVFVPF